MKSQIKGFSLVELLVTLSLISLLLVGTLISYRYFLQKNTLITMEDKLKTAIQYARVTAFSLDRSLYLAALPNKTDWSSGIGLYDAITSEILYEWRWTKSVWHVQWEGFGAGQYLKIAANPLHAASNGQISIQNTSTGEEARLVINRMGRVRTEQTVFHN